MKQDFDARKQLIALGLSEEEAGKAAAIVEAANVDELHLMRILIKALELSDEAAQPRAGKEKRGREKEQAKKGEPKYE